MVEIVAYNPDWPVEFQQIAERLWQGLGNLALRIDHIGSTAVPGLMAKDIIDIQITVAALDQQISSAMAKMGYSPPKVPKQDHRLPYFEGPDSEWEKLIFCEPPGQRRMHIHVRVFGRANQRYPLLFRDYLRTHPGVAASYEELKRLLAQSLADPQTYPEVKGPVVDIIYQAAEAWAADVNWQPQ
jgi:GrpB-like predicted nucleotidyltransferase (UPF0157 family)